MKASDRIRIRFLAWCFAIVLAVCAVVFLSLAGYQYLAALMPPPRAALVTGLALLALTAVVLGLTYWITARHRRRQRQRSRDDLEDLLRSRVDPLLRDWVDRHPEGAAAGTLLLGIAAGYSRSFRRVLHEFYEHSAQTERERREKRDS